MYQMICFCDFFLTQLSMFGLIEKRQEHRSYEPKGAEMLAKERLKTLSKDSRLEKEEGKVRRKPI